ncbi:MAG: HAD-IC family P-type ATPase [bacterium]|nr:HAD-IC family P-type ATPase [bacterium]
MEARWYTMSVAELFQQLDTDERGLTAAEAARRLSLRGPNALPEPTVPGLPAIFLRQFLSPLIYILLAAAVVVSLMGETTDAVVIGLVLLFNAIVGTVQEGKAQHTLAALKRFVETSAAVRRDGSLIVIPDTEIVAGDIVTVQEGDRVPADARLIAANALRTDEASLTGESTGVAKTAADLPDGDLPVVERKNMVFKGTTVVAGNGTAIIVATGIDTEIGRISKTIAAIDTEMPLKQNIRFLSRVIIIAALTITTSLFVAGISMGKPLREMFATVVSLAVSIIPEGLPVVLTLVLASGVWRMTKRHVLVKKLQAVEALGQASVIAVDKTGTLTKNEMLLAAVIMNGKQFTVQGSGYEPTGELLLHGAPIEPLNHPELVVAGRIASFCANAHAFYREDTKVWKVSGDPTEAALEVFSRKIGFMGDELESPKLFDLPFSYVTKYHVTIHTFNKKNFLSAVGAPEQVLARSSMLWGIDGSRTLTEIDREHLEATFARLSGRGLRVLAFAVNDDAPSVILSDGTLPPLTFCGFFGMKDPLREEVHEAVRAARAAGIRVVMITGDHTITARAIAAEAGIQRGGDVITGDDIERLSDDELLSRFAVCNIFARVTPEHKLRIIELFRKRGDVVAMTGDGVNDAPSLAAADLGVAMGKIGTEVAKEASDLMLLDDNFGSIIAAVEEGRSIYRTISKVVLYLFSTSIGEVLSISGALFLGLPLPVLPAQIIWLNFVTDGFLVAALALEPKEEGLLTRRFARPAKYLLDAAAARRMLFMGLVIALGTLLVFTYYLDGPFGKALTMSLTTLAVFQWFNAWNCRSNDESVFSPRVRRNMALVATTGIVVTLQLFAIYHPFMQRYLMTVPLTATDWLLIVGVASSVLVLEELRKLFGRYRTVRRSRPAPVASL